MKNRKKRLNQILRVPSIPYVLSWIITVFNSLKSSIYTFMSLDFLSPWGQGQCYILYGPSYPLLAQDSQAGGIATIRGRK